jgi:hypothetical protein
MDGMKKGPIGVWFSVALAVLVLGIWLGWKLGPGIALRCYRFRQEKIGRLSQTERAHVDSLLSELSALQTSWPYAAVANQPNGAGKKFLTAELARLVALQSRPDAQEIRPVIDLEIALAHVDAAVAEEQDHSPEAATTHMKSAQALFQSLGWQDRSEQVLRAVARRELDKRNREAIEAAWKREMDKRNALRQAREGAK